MYGSTCFGCRHAQHQELNNYSGSLWFYSWSVVIAVLLVVVGLAGPTTTNSVWCAGFGHLYRVTYTRCHIYTINSPDVGHTTA
jgi:hypothetical protein